MRRSRSFGTVAELYDRYRPSPAPQLAGYLGDITGLDVLDVAAGTGLVTRFLVGLGARVTAVEPDPSMRAVLERRSPDVVALDGVAESLPVDDASMALVVTSSAWHWFAQPAATQEFARVLRDGGRVFILGNGLDREHHWIEDLTEDPVDAATPPRDAGRHASHADEDLVGVFEGIERFEIAWTWRRTEEELLGLLQTYSAAIVRDGDERAQLIERARDELRRAAPDGVHDVAMRAHGVSARRRAR